MKTIVSSRNPDLARDFARDLLRRRDLQLVTATTTRELLQLLRKGADLCFLDRVLPDGDGAAACAAIRSDRKLASLPVVLMLGAGTARTDAAEARSLGFNDVVELPAPPGALTLLVGRLLGVPLRDNDRCAVRVHVYSRSNRDGETPFEYLGTSVDLSEMGMLVKSQRAVERGTELEVRFALPGQASEVHVRGTVVRVDGKGFAPARGLAISFDELLPADRGVLRQYLDDLLSGWPFRSSVAVKNGRSVVTIAGALEDGMDTGALESLDGDVDLRLRDLRRFGSDAVDRWSELLRPLRGKARLRLLECPAAFIHQANQIPNLLDQVEVLSFFAPYSCPTCGLEDERLVEVSALASSAPRTPPRHACLGCGGALVFDDLPERYFAFLDR